MKRDYLEHFDIGFAFLPQHSGKGYAYEAANEVLSMAGLNPEYATVLAIAKPDNVRSISLLTKLGLRFEKVMEVEGEKVHIYSNSAEALS